MQGVPGNTPAHTAVFAASLEAKTRALRSGAELVQSADEQLVGLRCSALVVWLQCPLVRGSAGKQRLVEKVSPAQPAAREGRTPKAKPSSCCGPFQLCFSSLSGSVIGCKYEDGLWALTASNVVHVLLGFGD